MYFCQMKCQMKEYYVNGIWAQLELTRIMNIMHKTWVSEYMSNIRQ